jgi:anti-anti-sigma factor
VVGATDAARAADCEDRGVPASGSAHRDPEAVPDRLEIEPVPRPDGAEVRVSGELTHGTATALTNALVEAERSGPSLLVLDLRNIRFVDSTGLGALVAAHNRSRQAARRLIVVVADGPIERLLSLTGLARRLETTSEPPTLG